MSRLIHLAIENPNNNIVLERVLLSLPGKSTEEIMSQTGQGGVIRIMMWNILIKAETNKKAFLITQLMIYHRG